MIEISLEELRMQIYDKLSNSYVLIGNELSLIHESVDLINTVAKQNGFEEYFNFVIDSNTNWGNIFSIFSSIGLFCDKKVINLQFIDSSLNSTIIKQLTILTKLLHSDILFICCLTQLTKSDECSEWFKKFFKFNIIVSCRRLEANKLPQLVLTKARNINLSLDQNAVKLLCKYYEGNLSALIQSLNVLSLQWPDGEITESRIKKSISKLQIFASINWINALLEGNFTKAIYILNHLEKNNSEAITLLRNLQYDVSLLMKLYYYKKQKSINIVMDVYNIWKTRRYLFYCALQRLNFTKLQTIVSLLIKVELEIRTEFNKEIWFQLELLSLLMCDNHFSIDY
ncbi:DNA polymerase III subunit delta [Candidatus Pantoea edessiphila]|uniref:DNA polymerase III subunit delta n=1 Tax=Candidatus Pantoea edessiphila TaxID=2044610 RepID=A0A2P5SZ14_9GAMM|nr:DNA polymerase III subunit delta [Candidatus Pantoea edessiphila]MBK4775288.1 DNA polymerase III subunit delta [Pantoea sp. Edef]PPI87574.1 DNA polymerase III subunit delta [Candidatus Pantoea edessiphila]